MKQKMFGFSLIELMVTVSIFAISIAIAVPSFTSIVAGNTLTSARDNLMSSFNFAKTEAIRLNTNVAVCPSTDGTVCSGTEDWSQGWIVYRDTGGGTTSTVGTILRVMDNVQNVDVFHRGETAGLTPSVFIRYVPQGYAEDAAPMPAQVIAFCDGRGNAAGRALLFGATTGQARPGNEVDANCP
tara:strand:+ start:3280 stop:3831 length:552 start_codon:yes stop_codon:yes gene_type:complete